MALRRMISVNLVDSDAFLDLPASAQNLYFHLNMRADDDGFVNKPRSVMRVVGASEEDLKLLTDKGYLLSFEDGVVTIRHWRVHNLLRKDRYTPTQYQELFSRLTLMPNGTYSDHPTASQELFSYPATKRQPDGNPGKVSIGQVR